MLFSLPSLASLRGAFFDSSSGSPLQPFEGEGESKRFRSGFVVTPGLSLMGETV